VLLQLHLALPRVDAGEEGADLAELAVERSRSAVASRSVSPAEQNVRYPSAVEASGGGGGAFDVSARGRAWRLGLGLGARARGVVSGARFSPQWWCGPRRPARTAEAIAGEGLAFWNRWARQLDPFPERPRVHASRKGRGDFFFPGWW
jgi:hypothetical protein